MFSFTTSRQFSYMYEWKGQRAELAPILSHNLGHRLAAANLWLQDGVIKKVLSAAPEGYALIHTTIVPTILQAGVKDNVIPTTARAMVNCRILPRGDDRWYPGLYHGGCAGPKGKHQNKRPVVLRTFDDDEHPCPGFSAAGGCYPADSPRCITGALPEYWRNGFAICNGGSI